MIQQIHDQTVDLCIFPGFRQVALLLELLLIVQKLLLYLILFQEIIQVIHILAGFCPGSHMQDLHGIRKLLSDTVQTLHGLFRPLCVFLPTTLLHFFRPTGKQAAVGAIPSRPGADHIILQFVNFLSGDIRHAAAQKMKYGIIRKIPDI